MYLYARVVFSCRFDLPVPVLCRTGFFKTGTMDLVKKKTVNFDLDTYERLSKLAAQLRMDNPGGGFVSMSAAVARLLDSWSIVEEIKAAQKADLEHENETK